MHDAPDGAVSIIVDHPFVPKTEWWSLCAQCNLSEAAHRETTLSNPRKQVIKLLNGLGFLDLRPHKYALGGSAVLALRGIRPIRDLDIYVSYQFYRQLKEKEKSGWVEWEANPHDPLNHSKVPYLMKVQYHVTCTAAREWKHGGAPRRVDVQELITDPEMVEGIPCIPLHVVYEWKKAVGRPKDIVDVQLIDRWRQQQ